MEILTTDLLWADFDPATEQLDSDMFACRTADGLLTKKLYFNGSTFPSGHKTRVYGAVCRPDDQESHKGVLVIGDYKKPVSEGDLAELAKQGFVTMSVDYAGAGVNGGLGTIYPDEQKHLYADRAQGLFYVGNSVKDNKIYEYVKNSRRAIGYLLEQEGVTEVSVVCVNKGSYIGTIVLGTDTRVARGIVVFGALYREYPLSEENATDDNLSRRLEEEDVARAWTMGLAPQSYVMQIHAPLYVVLSANSKHVDIVEESKMYYRVNDDSRLLILPTTADYLPQKYMSGVVGWLNGKTVGDDFGFESFVDDDGDYCVKLTTDTKIDDCSVWYCVNPSYRARYWARAKLVQDEGFCTAKLNTYQKDCDISAFCLLDGDIAVSSSLLDVKVRNAANVKLYGNVVFSGDAEQTIVPLNRGSDWWGKDIDVKLAKGYLGIVGVSGSSFATFGIADTSVKRSDVFTVSFDVCTDVRQKLTINVVCDYGVTNTVYRCVTKLIGDGKWQRVTVEAKDFHRVDDNRPMTDDDRADCLELFAETEIIVNNIMLV